MENIYKNLTGAGETTLSDRPCILDKITVNKAIANGVITAYDNSVTGGTVVATITEPATLLQNHYTLEYNGVCKTGLTMSITGASNVTVSYRPTMA